MLSHFTALDLVFGTLLFLILLALAVIDLKTFRLPNILTFTLLATGLIYAYIAGPGLLAAAIGAALGYGLFVAVEIGFLKARGVHGLGRGDAKLIAAGGAWCGWMGLPYIMLIGSLMGIFAALTPMFKSHEKGWIPFGPFLALAIFIVWVSQNLASV